DGSLTFSLSNGNYLGVVGFRDIEAGDMMSLDLFKDLVLAGNADRIENVFVSPVASGIFDGFDAGDNISTGANFLITGRSFRGILFEFRDLGSFTFTNGGSGTAVYSSGNILGNGDDLINTDPVPVPAAALLFAPALGFVAARRRKQAQA
ncbi:MAG: hypothetical protein HRU11_14600, partial [Parvularculaceae bacterium]|nr:hypothetical protein [Parvularculaceae bacterium]